jgi:hypothetical protein
MTDDVSRPAPTTPDSEFTLTIEEAALRYDHAGHPRTDRSIQRYCAKGHLDCRRIEMPFGDKYLITPASVAKHIAYIEEVRPATTGRDVSRPVATGITAEDSRGDQRQERATSPDPSRRVGAEMSFQDRYMEHLEMENSFLREQNTVLLERVKETNILTGRLQEMLTPLLATSERNEAATSGSIDRTS